MHRRRVPRGLVGAAAFCPTCFPMAAALASEKKENAEAHGSGGAKKGHEAAAWDGV